MLTQRQWSPSKPIPLKSVAGSVPWKPICPHFLVIRDSRATCGIRRLHNYEQKYIYLSIYHPSIHLCQYYPFHPSIHPSIHPLIHPLVPSSAFVHVQYSLVNIFRYASFLSHFSIHSMKLLASDKGSNEQ